METESYKKFRQIVMESMSEAHGDRPKHVGQRDPERFKYKEVMKKLKDGSEFLDSIEIEMSGKDAATATRYSRTKNELAKKAKEIAKKIGEADDYFRKQSKAIIDASDLVATIIIKTASFDTSIAKQVKKMPPSSTVDYVAVVDEIREKYSDYIKDIDKIIKTNTTVEKAFDKVTKKPGVRTTSVKAESTISLHENDGIVKRVLQKINEYLGTFLSEIKNRYNHHVDDLNRIKSYADQNI